MIIVEGPDGAGKTTLINNILAKYPDLPVAPRVVSKETNALVDMQAWVNYNLGQGFQYTLYDRHRLISEFIYGPMLRSDHMAEGFTSMAWVYWSLKRFHEIKPVIIYCLPPLATIKANLAGDESNSKVWEHIEGMYTAYLHRASLDIAGGQQVIIYDYTSDGKEEDPLGPLHFPINQAYERANK